MPISETLHIVTLTPVKYIFEMGVNRKFDFKWLWKFCWDWSNVISVGNWLFRWDFVPPLRTMGVILSNEHTPKHVWVRRCNLTTFLWSFIENLTKMTSCMMRPVMCIRSILLRDDKSENQSISKNCCREKYSKSLVRGNMVLGIKAHFT